MTDRRVGVRLDLTNAGFNSRLADSRREAKSLEQAVDQIGEGAARASRKTSSFFGVMKAGASGAKNSLGELGGEVRKVLGQAATLGGALSIGAAIKSAQDVTKSYKDLAFAISVGSGQAMSWQQVQANVEAVSGRWKLSNAEVAESYADIFQETGNASFAVAAIDKVGAAAIASGKSTKVLSGIAGTLNEKFGIGAEGLEQALAASLELGNKGGVSVEELGEKLGFVGASAKLLGMKGQAGLQQVIGMLNLADDAIGPPRQKFQALSQLLEGMANPERAKAVQKALGVQLLDAKGNVHADALERVLAKTRGKQSELAKVFSGGELKLMASLGEPFAKAFEETKGDVQTKMTAGIEAYRAALGDAGKVAFDGAALQKEAMERLKDPQRQLQDAMTRFEKAFQRPEMIAAIDKLAASAPRLAQSFANLIGFAVNHPALAAGAVVGGVAAKGAAGAVLNKVSEAAMKTAADTFSSFAAKNPGWATAGKALGVAAAALVAYEVGKSLIDASMDDDEKRLDAARGAGAAAEAMAKHGTGTPAERAEAAAKLRREIESLENEGPGTANKLFGSIANAIDPNVERAETRHAREIAERKAQLKLLEGSTGTAPPALLPAEAAVASGAGSRASAADKVAREVATGEPKKVTISNEEAMARAIGRQVGQEVRSAIAGLGPGTNGLPPVPSNTPGSAAR